MTKEYEERTEDILGGTTLRQRVTELEECVTALCQQLHGSPATKKLQERVNSIVGGEQSGSRVWIVVRRMHAPMSNDTIDVPLVTRDYEAAAHYIKTFARPYVSFELIEKGVE